MRKIRLFAAFIIGCFVPWAIFRVQSASSDVGSLAPNFAKLFPKPTGQNGYEEFVMAADEAEASPAWRDYENRNYGEPGATIEMKRSLLADPTVRAVLATIRVGLGKQCRSPRVAPELQTLVPELRDFRSVARLMCVEMDERFAEGQTTKAIDCLNDGLDFGRRVQVGTLSSGVIGLYIENITLSAFRDHLDQLTTSDCDKLIRVALNQLKRPDPQIALVIAEREMYIRTLREYRTDALALLSQLDPGPNAAPSDHRDYADVCRLVRANPESGAATLDQAADLVGLHYDQTLAEIRRPVWEREYPGPIERQSPAARLIYSICPPSYSRLGDRFASEQVMVQILAAHAAVLRYERLRGQLPGSLGELKLGSLAIDPFTGGTLGYRRLSSHAYEISSVGATDPGGSKHPSKGQRVPIVVPYPPERSH